MYELSVNSQVIQSIYDLPLGKSKWSQVAKHMREDLSAASIKIVLTDSQETIMVLAETDFFPYTAAQQLIGKLGDVPDERLGQHAVQGVALHIARIPESACSGANLAVGRMEIGTGVKLMVDLFSHPDKKGYNNIDLWRFQYYLIHLKRLWTVRVCWEVFCLSLCMTII